MARILFAWELGAGLGHLNRMLPLARALQELGHMVFLVVRDLSRIQDVICQQDRFLWFQAPLWLPRRSGWKPFSYAELLLSSGGFLVPNGLMGLVRAWHTLFATIQPDLLIAEHAPVSLLASRALPFRKIVLGTGFCIPPAVSPLPVIRTWESCDGSRILVSEKLALDNANHVLAALVRPPLRQLHELFGVDAGFLTVWPELDHYQNRGGQGFIHTGPLTETAAGIAPEWPHHPGKKLFVYLIAAHPALAPALENLADGEACVLAHVPGLGSEQMEAYASPSLKFSAQPVQLAKALREADAVVCHGGMGTVSLALQTGRPVLVLPAQGEQRMTGERISAMGCGLFLEHEQVGERLRPCLNQLLNDGAMHLQAKTFSAKYGNIPIESAVNTVVATCVALLEQR